MNRLQHHASRLIAVGSLLGTLLIATAAQGQCPSYPFALPAQLLVNVPTNTVIMKHCQTEVQLNNFGWLTWTGDTSDAALVASLTPPGNSTNYVNPDNLADHEISVGDWVLSRPMVSKKSRSQCARQSNQRGHRCAGVRRRAWLRKYPGLPRCRLRAGATGRLPPASQNRITIYFIGFADCSGGPGV